MTPISDYNQLVRSHALTVSVPGQARDYDDVFGNRARRVLIETPFEEMTIEARSVVQLLDIDPLGFGPLRVKSSIPLVWMPWQRQVLEPYLFRPSCPRPSSPSSPSTR